MTGPQQSRPAHDPPEVPVRSAVFLRALASRPVDVARLVEELNRRVHDEDSLIDLLY